MSIEKRIGFIGVGEMAEIMIRAMLEKALVSKEQIIASHYRPERLKELGSRYGVICESDNRKACESADIVVLSVRPQSTVELMEEITTSIRSDQLVISMVASLSLRHLEDRLGNEIQIFRIMPTPLIGIGKGIVNIVPNRRVDTRRLTMIEGLISSICTRTEVVTEKMMDTSVSLGAAAHALLNLSLKYLVEAAIDIGFTRIDAEKMLFKQYANSTRLMSDGSTNPDKLIKEAATPGGLTAAALEVLEKAGLKDIVAQGVQAGFKRTEELGAAFDIQDE